VHARRGSLLLEARQLDEAKQEYLLAVKLQPTGEVWSLLAELYHHDGHLAEAMQAWERASDLLRDPTPALLSLGYANLEANQPLDALVFFDRTAAEIERQNLGSDSLLLAELAHGRAVAYSSLADWNRAVQFQEETVRLAPDRKSEWLYLAGLYQNLGRASAAQAARDRAASLVDR